jgi:hypothetical protein
MKHPKNSSGPDIKQTATYPVVTSQEMEALNQAAANGKHGRHYEDHDLAGARVHQTPGAKHRVEIVLTNSEREADVPFLALQQLTAAQDADSALAMLYIVASLAPPGFKGDVCEGWIDIDDVISKIGWDPRSSAERREMQKRIESVLEFGARAVVVGERTGAYKDKHTGKRRDTTISASLWQVGVKERLKPEDGQVVLFPEDEPLVRALVSIVRPWIPLLTSGQLAQYLPLGEVLGSIPGNKPSGAWARVIGLSLASFWRRCKGQALDGTIRPTRRELLERYPPKTGPLEMVASKHSARLVEYWCGAIQILAESGFIAPTGEATRTAEEIRARYPHRNWVDAWLDETIDIEPGESMRAALLALM